MDNSEDYMVCDEPGERIKLDVGYPYIFLCRRHRLLAALLGKPWLLEDT
jgi:hypothetical protein